MQKYNKELVKVLSEITNTKKYFGEFSNARDIQLDPSKLPMIYVDFVGEQPESSYELKLTFSLYIAHAAFSKNENTREKAHNDLEDLIEQINEKLYTACILDSQPIELKGSKKILDRKNENAYITLFQKGLEFTIPKIHTQGEHIE